MIAIKIKKNTPQNYADKDAIKKKNEIIKPIKIYNRCQNKNLSIDLLDFFFCSNIRLFKRTKKQ